MPKTVRKENSLQEEIGGDMTHTENEEPSGKLR